MMFRCSSARSGSDAVYVCADRGVADALVRQWGQKPGPEAELARRVAVVGGADGSGLRPFGGLDGPALGGLVGQAVWACRELVRRLGRPDVMSVWPSGVATQWGCDGSMDVVVYDCDAVERSVWGAAMLAQRVSAAAARHSVPVRVWSCAPRCWPVCWCWCAAGDHQRAEA